MLTIAPSSAPWLGRNVSIAIPVLFGYVLAICLSSFVHASVTDPGVSIADSHLKASSDQAPIDSTTQPSSFPSFGTRRGSLDYWPLDDGLDTYQILCQLAHRHGSPHQVLQDVQHLASTSSAPLPSV